MQPNQPYYGFQQESTPGTAPSLLHLQVQQQVKTYRSGFTGYAEKKFMKDAAKLALEGWRVQSQSTSGYNWFSRRANVVTVVYVRRATLTTMVE